MSKKKRVVRLNNDYTNASIVKQQNHIKEKLPRRKYMGIISVIAVVLMSLSVVNLVKSYTELESKMKLEKKYTEEDKNLGASLDMKEKQVVKLQNDDYVAKYARVKYLYSKDDELVFTTPDLLTTNQGNEKK
ncbi:FtsB family cell division protein [Floricoccus penangensis]|uniref:Septum formation initiator n=1 Tax=Floricoccus penangensis TaxID=1859475 RepID=A0A9Q5P1H2_9LACT|nr:septum formation initiator family protein [Floricoccus penangensis]OFI47971.1 hypothetical protein BG262_00235 [Floricoccus penangensis]URZ87496.1 septum formation initiator family protein [Floricoccus penangensis]